MWGTVVSSVRRVFVERKLPHRTLVKSQSLTFDSASPLHPTSIVSVQIYQDNPSSITSDNTNEATLTFKDAEITYKDNTTITTLPDNNYITLTTPLKESTEVDTTIPRYNGMARSVTFSGLATIQEEEEGELCKEEKVYCPDTINNITDNIELNTSESELNTSGSEDQISSNEEEQSTLSNSSTSEIEMETINVLNQAVGNSEEPIVVEIKVDDTIVEEIKTPSPTTPKKLKQFTNVHRKTKIKKSRTSDSFYIKLGKGEDIIDRESSHDTKAVIVDCVDYQQTVIPFILAIARALHTCGGIPA